MPADATPDPEQKRLESLQYIRAQLAACEELARSRGYSLDDDADPTGPPDGIWRPIPEILTNPWYDWRADLARKAETAKQSPTSGSSGTSGSPVTYPAPASHETTKQFPLERPVLPSPLVGEGQGVRGQRATHETAKQSPNSGSSGSSSPPSAPATTAIRDQAEITKRTPTATSGTSGTSSITHVTTEQLPPATPVPPSPSGGGAAWPGRTAGRDGGRVRRGRDGGGGVSPRQWIGTTHACRLLGLGSEDTIKAWAARGYLRSRRLPNRRTQLLLQDVLRLAHQLSPELTPPSQRNPLAPAPPLSY